MPYKSCISTSAHETASKQAGVNHIQSFHQEHILLLSSTALHVELHFTHKKVSGRYATLRMSNIPGLGIQVLLDVGKTNVTMMSCLAYMSSSVPVAANRAWFLLAHSLYMPLPPFFWSTCTPLSFLTRFPAFTISQGCNRTYFRWRLSCK